MNYIQLPMLFKAHSSQLTDPFILVSTPKGWVVHFKNINMTVTFDNDELDDITSVSELLSSDYSFHVLLAAEVLDHLHVDLGELSNIIYSKGTEALLTDHSFSTGGYMNRTYSEDMTSIEYELHQFIYPEKTLLNTELSSKVVKFDSDDFKTYANIVTPFLRDLAIFENLYERGILHGHDLRTHGIHGEPGLLKSMAKAIDDNFKDIEYTYSVDKVNSRHSLALGALELSNGDKRYANNITVHTKVELSELPKLHQVHHRIKPMIILASLLNKIVTFK